jgi:hypothetical protein
MCFLKDNLNKLKKLLLLILLFSHTYSFGTETIIKYDLSHIRLDTLIPKANVTLDSIPKHKIEKEVVSDGDKFTKRTKTFTSLCLASLILIPILSIPFAILGLIFGKRALKSNTSKPSEIKASMKILRVILIILSSIALFFGTLVILFLVNSRDNRGFK